VAYFLDPEMDDALEKAIDALIEMFPRATGASITLSRNA
jgi:hypothetical protein